MRLSCCFLALFLCLFAAVAADAQTNDTKPSDSSLVRLLQSKGIITQQEAAMVLASSPSETSMRLAKLLLSKGVIDQREYDQTILALGAESAVDADAPRLAAASVRRPAANTEIGKADAPQTKPDTPPQKPNDGAVTTASKIPVKLYGSILFNSNYVDRGANTIDIPLFAQKRGTSEDQNHQNFNATLRQTRFGLRYEGSIFQDAKLTGVFEFDLLGGKPAFTNGANFDLFRLRLAYGRIDWKNDSIEAGQDWAVFEPLNPTTLASYAIPGFSTSGNLWNRMPQIRYEHRAGSENKFVFTTAILDPNAGDNAGNTAVRVIGLGERSAIPALEARMGFTASTHGRESSGGVSGHYSRLLGVAGNPVGTTVRSPIDSYGVGGDVNLWLTSSLRVSGEAFHGRALGIFSGNVAQSSAVIAGRARGINSTGGWLEVHGEAPGNYDGPWKKVSANIGYGIEANRDQDLLVGIRKSNQSFMANWQYKFSPNFTFALEYRRIVTDWFQQSFAKQKLNWADVAFLYSF